MRLDIFSYKIINDSKISISIFIKNEVNVKSVYIDKYVFINKRIGEKAKKS